MRTALIGAVLHFPLSDQAGFDVEMLNNYYEIALEMRKADMERSNAVVKALFGR